jgi:hypothetical protein
MSVLTIRPCYSRARHVGQSAHLLFLDPVPQLSEAVWVELQSIYLLWLGPILVSAPLTIPGTNDPHLYRAAHHVSTPASSLHKILRLFWCMHVITHNELKSALSVSRSCLQCWFPRLTETSWHVAHAMHVLGDAKSKPPSIARQKSRCLL